MTDTADIAQLARRVRLVSWLSLAWMSMEGIVGVTSGIATQKGADLPALSVAEGIDARSAILVQPPQPSSGSAATAG